MKTDTFSSEHFVVTWDSMSVDFRKRAFHTLTEAIIFYDNLIGLEGLKIQRLRTIIQAEDIYP